MRHAAVVVLFLCASLVPARAAADRRPTALAGTWYPGDRIEVLTEVQRLLRVAASAPTLGERPVALVVPHAGWSYSGAAAAAAYRTLAGATFARVVLVGPSHHAAFRGFAVDRTAAYATPLGDVPTCTDAIAALGDAVHDERAAFGPEHSLEIELPFLQQQLRTFCVVPILAGATTAGDERSLAERLATLDDGRTLFVFSSDFTHYGPRFGYVPFGQSARGVGAKIHDQDARAAALLASADAKGFRALVEESGATICGRAGLGVLAELIPRIAPRATATLLAHYASTELPGGADDNSVDYLALAFTRGAPKTSTTPLGAPPPARAVGVDAPPLTPAEGESLARLARAALRTRLLDTGDLSRALAELPPGNAFDRLQATFVTLNYKRPADVERYGKLRGCIGQVVPTYPLFVSVVRSAVDAALRDPRFEPVQGSELDRIAIEVTALSAPHPIASWREIRLREHGIVLEKNGRRALFLPQVAPEQHWTIEQTLEALSRKAGLQPDAWREGASFQVFTGQVFEEPR